MLVSEFIRQKNKIIFDKLGVILVPEKQIAECEQFKLSFDSSNKACPYCLAYTSICENCPMAKAGNDCYYEESTWKIFVDAIYTQTNIIWISDWYKAQPELVELYEQYNAELNQ